MNEKISFQDIADAISEKSGISKKLSEDFLRELMAVIEVALQKDGAAKIKGLGTFKLMLVEERKSVNVQTGAEIIIPAHQKVSFAPEKSLKEAVNKPFSHLETYVLRDEGPVDPEPADSEEDELSEASEMESAGSAVQISAGSAEHFAAEKVAEVAGEERAEVTPEEPEKVAEPVKVDEVSSSESLQETAQTAGVVETEAAESQAVSAAQSVAENIADAEASAEPEAVAEAQGEAEQISKEEIASADEEAEPEKSESASKQKSSDGEIADSEEPEEQKNKTLGYVILAFVVLCIFAITVIWYTDRSFFKRVCNPDYNPIEVGSDKAPVINVKPKEEAKPVVADSVAVDSVAVDSAKAEIAAVTDSAALMTDSVLSQQPAGESPADASVDDTKAEKPEAAAKAEKVSVKYDSNFKPDFIDYMKANHPNVSLETNGSKKIKVAKGQRLTTIALDNYGDKNYWVYVYLYNYKVIKNPNSVNVGMKLLIPKLDKSLVDGANPVTMEMASEVRKALVEKK